MVTSFCLAANPEASSQGQVTRLSVTLPHDVLSVTVSRGFYATQPSKCTDPTRVVKTHFYSEIAP